ncbi:hypothetical protein LCGC14_1416790 [marine sediment metagenome]|uniref:Uncharacterized protein n=1 Tax=marine sediment metagenome TaxID=412755 RepID=A0A0F9MUC5_9ZZZZ
MPHHTTQQRRLVGRQAVIDGQVPGMDVTEYDRQFGTGV